MKKQILTLFLVLSFVYKAISQDEYKTTPLTGQIIDQHTKNPLLDTHIFNLNSVSGTVADSKGVFKISVRANDTLLISHIGYHSIKLKITTDLLKGNELIISLYQEPEEISEVVVKSTQLIGVLEIDAKNISKDKFTRIQINGLPQTYEIEKNNQKSYALGVDAIYHPIDFVYNLFGKKPKQLKKLKKLKEDDSLRYILDKKFDREVMMEYLEMDEKELQNLLDDCNYSKYYIKQASDLQITQAVIECYEKYKALQKGSTSK